jgi:hypothetical protein
MRAATVAVIFSCFLGFSCSGKSQDLGKAPAPWIRVQGPRTWKIPNRLPWRLYADLRGTYAAEYHEMQVSINGAMHSTAAIDPGLNRVFQIPLSWNVRFYQAMQAHYLQEQKQFDGQVEVTVRVKTLSGKAVASSTFKLRLVCIPCMGV